MDKKALMLILGGPKGEDDEESEGKKDSEPSIDAEAKDAAAGDLIRAIKQGDRAAFVAAMDSYLEACGHGGSYED